MTWIGFGVLAVSAVLLVSYSPVCACSCEPLPPMTGIDGVTFIGNVTEIAVQSDDDFGETILMQLHVNRSWVGVTEKEVTIATLPSDASCGKPLELGVEYLVFGNPYGGWSWVVKQFGVPTINLCDRTRPLSGARQEVWQLDSLLAVAAGELVGNWEYLPESSTATPVRLVMSPLQGDLPSGVFRVLIGDKATVLGTWRISATDRRTRRTVISVSASQPHALTQPLLETGEPVEMESVNCLVTDKGLEFMDEEQNASHYSRTQETNVEGGGWGSVKNAMGP